jgi:pimeloyl-ACP methyl ester carboxylesterase
MLNYTTTKVHNKTCLEFTLCGRDVKLILPPEGTANGKWLLKTEYFTAFPSFEIKMLNRGYHVAYIANKTRWHVDEDDEAKEALCKLLESEFGLCPKCMPVGMSCGGLQAIYFAAAHPERVAALYLDAPVTNLLSCPAHVGKEQNEGRRGLWEEFYANTGITLTELINYRNHPIDRIPEILAKKIPIILVCGDADSVVPYTENGYYVDKIYREGGGVIETYIKPGCDHHPHGLSDPAPIIAFAEKYYL